MKIKVRENTMSEDLDKNLMKDHDYDGIQELDNDLPFWWIALFISTAIIGLSYMAYYGLGIGPGQEKEFEQEVARAELMRTFNGPTGKQAEVANKPPEVLPEPTEENTRRGKEIFTKNCFACHGPEGAGLVGPNLTDNFFVHGNSLAEVVHIITIGVPAKGMISWSATLSKEEIFDVASFVHSLQGKNLPGKPPEGKEIK
jgi:cytochrome c oxidase cbb3-type subunit III